MAAGSSFDRSMTGYNLSRFFKIVLIFSGQPLTGIKNLFIYYFYN